MNKGIVAAIVLSAVLAPVTFGDVGYDARLIESWEGTMGEWTIHDWAPAEAFPYPSGHASFDDARFADGAMEDGRYAPAVTNGDQALALNFKQGWQHGLQSNYIGYEGDPHYFDNLIGAERLGLDFSSSAELSGYPGVGVAPMITLFMHGRYNTGPGLDGILGTLDDEYEGLAHKLGLTSDYHGLAVNYGDILTSVCDELEAPDGQVHMETLTWDLSRAQAYLSSLPAQDVPLIPAFGEYGGWLQVRIQTNFGWDGGEFIVDNLRGLHYECPPPAGDFNGDGSVSHGDYTMFADYYGWALEDIWAVNPDYFQPASYLYRPHTQITQAFFTIWADAMGTWMPDSATVPEPATLALLAIGAALLRRRR